MDTNNYAVIMAGGIGSRFWPMSTTDFPKQFIDMLGTGKSLLQQTFSRIAQFIPDENILILTNDRYKDLVLEQLPSLTEKQLVLEPVMRNTAPCILLAALKIAKWNPEAKMLVAPSDHWIEDEVSFANDVLTSFKAIGDTGKLVTLGINPTFPNTGYGYIEEGAVVSSETGLHKVTQFREKPDYETAKEFIAQGNFLWNAGIFSWSVSGIINAFEAYLPEMLELFNKGIAQFNTENEAVFVSENYGNATNISIDFGILEKSELVFVIKANFDWNDLGTWGSLHDKITTSESENAVVRAVPHLREATGNMILTDKEKLVVVDGLKDYIVVDKEESLLIFPKKKEQEIKQLLAELKDKFGEKYT
ncbi:putative mannose-1-phosphate guanylyltransferase [unidentified eubacterium SCB49]|nr:putative mannose-1-phosphate guanylyltransferase [unidentified eubacterium SCB49]